LDSLISLQELVLHNNKITEIPLTILNNTNLLDLRCDDTIVINPIITRFLNRNKMKTHRRISPPIKYVCVFTKPKHRSYPWSL